MEYWALLIVSVCIATVRCGTNFSFHYYEGVDPYIEEQVPLTGSHANLGQFPFWCLGDIARCPGGYSLDLWAKFRHVEEDTPAIIVLSTGGHSPYSQGVYLLQRYGNEYEFGTALGASAWRVRFRVLPGVWVHLKGIWAPDTGLLLQVDGKNHTAPQPETRDYEKLDFDPFPDVVVGLDLDGTPHTEDIRFEIDTLTFYNWTAQEIELPSNEEDLFWLGCKAESGDSSVAVSGTFASATDCRQACMAYRYSAALFRAGQFCECDVIENVQDVSTDSAMCAGVSAWQVYITTALTTDVDFELIVTVETLGDKAYVKPLESVLIRITPNFDVIVPYTLDLGDGTVLEMVGDQLSYFWHDPGTYEIVAETVIGIATVQGSTQFDIEDVDEGVKGDFLMLSTYHGKESREGHILFASLDHEDPSCVLDYNDNNSAVLRLSDLQDYVENIEYEHVFSKFGGYVFRAECVNDYGTTRNQTTFTAQKFETSFHFHQQGEVFSTSMEGYDAFFDEVYLTHNDKNASLPLHRNQTSLAIFPEELRLQENFITYNYRDTIVDKRILFVQNAIGEPDILSSRFSNGWTLTTNITVRIPAGNNLFLNISFSAGEDQLFYIHYLPVLNDLVFEVIFSTLGYYPVTVNISNDISSSTAEALVSVEVPIQTIALEVQDITDKAFPVHLNVSLNEGFQGPARVRFEIDHGDGHVETYHYESETHLFTPYRHAHEYSHWGIYFICVRAFNEISAVTDCISVQVGQRITYIDIHMPSAGRFRVNEEMKAIVWCPKGSDRTYIADFGDGNTFVFTDRYLKDTEHFEPISSTEPPTTTDISTSTMDSLNDTASDNGTSISSTTGTTFHFNGTTTVGGETSNMAPTEASSTGFSSSSGSSTPVPTPPVRKRRELGANSTGAFSGDDNAETSTSGNSSSSNYPYTGMETTTESLNWTTTVVPGDNSTSFYNQSEMNGTTTAWSVSDSTTEAEATDTTTTTEPPTTTTQITTTTTESIPDDALDPFSTNSTGARRRRDGTIALTHRYETQGTYTVKIRVVNHFNWAKNNLCPRVVVVDSNVSSCDAPILNVGKMSSSFNKPLDFIRSDSINLTASVDLGSCSHLTPTYSWKAVYVVEEEGRRVERPVHDICLLESSGKIMKIPRVSLKFGLYKTTLTVSPVGHPLATTMKDFYFNVNPSPPYAIIDGNEEHQWFLVYATTMIKFQKSVDPDFSTTDGLEFDLVCMDEKASSDVASESRDSLTSKSSLIMSDVTYRYSSKNPVRLYEYGSCFSAEANVSKDIRFPNGELQLPSEYFVSDVPSFAMHLFVTKGQLTTSAVMTFEIRLSNSSNLLDQLDDLLKSKDTTGVMRAVEALTAGLITSNEGNGTEEDFDKKEELTELKTKLIGALDSVSTGVKDLGQCSGMLSLVGDLTKDASEVSESARVGATSAIKNSAKVTEEFQDEPLDTLTGIGQQVVGGVSNVLPKEDAMAAQKAAHRKAREKAEKEAAAAAAAAEGGEQVPPGVGESDGADIVLEEVGEDDGEIDENFKGPLPYLKLLKKCGVRHSRQLDWLYEYIVFYESIFRFVMKNKSEEIMISAEILKMNRNDIFCYLTILEEPEDLDWYVIRFCDEEKYRRDMIRKDADRDVSNSFLGSIDSVSGVLLNKTEGNQTVSLSAPGLNVAMKKVSANESDDGSDSESMVSETGGGIQVPKSVLASSSGNDSAEVGQTMIVNADSPFTYGDNSDTVGTAVLTLKYSVPGTKDEVKVENSTEPIAIYLASDPTKIAAPKISTLIVNNNDFESAITYHGVNVTKNDSTLHVVVRPLNESKAIFTLLLQYQDFPNDTHHMESAVIPHPEGAFPNAVSEEEEDQLRHTYFADPSFTTRAGMYRIGVKIKEGVMDVTASQLAFYYSWQTFLGGCRFWNASGETWDTDGCTVGNRTTPNQTECLCTHLTSFGGDMVVPPNTIDFNNVWSKFKNLDENAAVFGTVIGLLGLYVILMIWARVMDKRDLIKWGASPLEDNLPTDNYHYQLSVSTGVRKKAGTSSNISLILSGETCDTGVRRLFDGKRKRHATGSIMNYILSTESRLGPLSYMRVWHDNSGEGKDRSWFLDQVEVTDLQTGERYFFLNNRWLAVEEDDGMVDRILPVASIDDLVAFKQLFSSSVRKKLTSDHLWFSVFSRPTRSKFTRVQRISCCMSLLFLTMITNAMWFKSPAEGNEDSGKQTVALKLGPFSFTLQQVFISLASTIIVFPPSFALVTLFRRSKQKKNTVLQSNQRLPKRGKWRNNGNNNSHSELWGRKPKTSKLKKFKQSIQDLIKGSQGSKYAGGGGGGDEDEGFSSIPEPTIAGDPDAQKKKQKKKKKPMMLPFWCNYVAWVLCFFSVMVPAFFTILYSMEWGKEKANEWLTTFLLSFFQSVIVVQPIKVLCLVAFIACILKKPDLDEDGDCSDELNNAIASHDQELASKGQEAIDEIAERRRKANADFDPPDPEALEQSRLNRLKEVAMENILKEILIYGFFVLVLFFLSYQQRDGASFHFNENLKSMFLGKFEKISTVLDYWVWLENTLLPTLYVAKYHNGSKIDPWWDRRCIFDFEARRMGIARIRQMRIKEDSCGIPTQMADAINHCRNDYNWFDDDTQPYFPHWKKPSEEEAEILEDMDDIDPWVYQSSVKLANAPYMATLQTYKGGGYVLNFERSYRRTVRNLTRLRQEDWLDLRTRALILEFTVYNPNANLYASVIMVTEFPATGAAVPRSEFKVMRLQSYVGGFAIVVILFEVLYCCFTIFFFVRCMKKVKKFKCKYFQSFWDLLEFVLLCFAVTCIVMYVFKHILTEVAMRSLKRQSKAEFINFQSLALYDEMYGYMTAIVVFLASIQFLKLLQFNQKMNMLGDTIKLATKDLKVFSIAFILYFLAFVLTAYLLFGQQMAAYNGFIQSAESAFAFTLGDFDFNGMTAAQRFLGPLFFFAFIAVIYIGMMSIFLTIIADSFTTVKESVGDKQNQYEMVDFVWRKFKGIIGVK